MRRPRIAVNCDFDPGKPGSRFRRQVTLYEPYIRSIVEAGGLPILVPPSAPAILKEYLELCDGILFTGGDDYPPSLYGQKPRPEVEEQPSERAESDQALMKLTLKSAKPALGICAGLQLLNIATGGALIQHLSNTAEHKALNAEKDSSHAVEIYPNTWLSRLFAAKIIQVNSSHHQAADPERVGRGLKISARAEDGTIEGLELEESRGRFFIFVQWHPERISDESHHKKIFSAFIQACRPRS